MNGAERLVLMKNTNFMALANSSKPVIAIPMPEKCYLRGNTNTTFAFIHILEDGLTVTGSHRDSNRSLIEGPFKCEWWKIHSHNPNLAKEVLCQGLESAIIIAELLPEISEEELHAACMEFATQVLDD